MKQEDFFPPWSPPPTKKHRRKPEATVQRQIAAWLIQQGAVVAITDAGLLHRVGLDMACGIPEGWPDITACLPGGKFLGVECKSATGRQSKGQICMGQRIFNIGGTYILASSLESFCVQFRDLI